MKLALSALTLMAFIGTAQAAEPAAPPVMLVMPQSLIDLAREFIRNPVLPGAVDLWAGLTACEQANKPGADGGGCPVVAQALEASRKAAPAAPAPAKP